MNHPGTLNLFGEKNFTVHGNESNQESQKYLEAGRKEFGKNLKILFDAFMSGSVINSNNSPVGDFRRRKLDLELVNGVKISLHSTNGRIKNWYFSPSDIIFNQKFK